ncbi:hypothetical protein H6G97_37785 [Nostoc flagelliforme FACHB-838]|uniref:Uncharacterized protein n=1 Tax=Nostoc flagelliforme FACHB-838 TaxID=2692904 RepID=A0ABR8E2T5_9NOSO|nr:hypothetical protein [Nostoc flagelliforme FACHB-838]
MKTSRLFNFILIALLSLGVVVVMKDNDFQTNSTKNAIASETGLTQLAQCERQLLVHKYYLNLIPNALYL